MAAYFNENSDIQGGDGLQTLVLMNPEYVSYSDSPQPSQPGNFVFLNNHHHATLPHASVPPPAAQAQQLVGVPLSTQPPVSSDISALHAFIPRAQYNMYSFADMAAPAHDVTRFQQGLSLSLSSQQSGFGAQAAGGRLTPSASAVSNGVQSVLLNSKYLKATQELLEEVVNVGTGVFKNSNQSPENLKTASGDGGSLPRAAREEPSGEETNGKHGDGIELTTAERQEFQMKKAKLVNMLDEVERRYRQYHNQMQIVISWFEQAVGIGAAKTYTALALQTISKQFRCLKDAILGQIKTASRSLGEEDNMGSGGGRSDGSSRLKFVDNQLRQQRALQQLGMIQHNAWRPQRGLPERSVSVLRAWLFEHFLHPYPKDSDKHMLAKQTGLTRSQVSNWFINARVRLWKPMVEEMYLEEIKEQEKEQNRSDDNKITSKSEQSEENPSSESFHHPPPPQGAVITSVSTPPTATGVDFQNPSGFALIGSSQMEGLTQFSPKKPRNNDVGFTLTGNPTDFMGGLGGYHQFQSPYSGNGVSLTLGLPHCDNLSISGTHQSFLPNQNIELDRGVELRANHEFEPMNQQPSSHSVAIYDAINIQNRKRFAAQLLPDFVA